MWYYFEKPLKICCPFHPKAHKPGNYNFLDWNLCKISNDFQWKWKGYIVNWVTRYQYYEMVFGDNQVCLPSSSCVHGLKLSFGRRPRPPEVCGWADGKYGRFGCTASAATMGTTSYSSPFDTLITGPAEADTTSFLSITSLGLLSSILWLIASKGLI